LLKRYLVLPVLLVVSALVFAACGSSGASDEDQITEAIQTSATSTDPAVCAEFETQAFMEQSSDMEGKEAVKQCEEDATKGSENAESVAVSEVEVEGAGATADAAFTGGGFDGQTVSVSLVKEGDQWQLDEVTGFVKLDNAKLAETLEEKLEESSNEISEETAGCIVESFEEASQPEVEELLLSGSSEPFVELAEECS
jgi:hypothetical protein